VSAPAKTATREGTRERILDTAIELLRVRGLKHLTQPRVAAAAGIPQGHLTYYFPRRTDLLTAVARRSVEILGQELASFFAGDGWPGADASEQARALALTGFHVKNRERTRMLLGLLVESDEDPMLRETLRADVARVRAMVTQGMGEGASELDVDIHLATLWGLSIRHLLFAPAGRGDDGDHGVEDQKTDALLGRLPDWVRAVRETTARTSRVEVRTRRAK
jgi:AcrR family transcriptional regulator